MPVSAQEYSLPRICPMGVVHCNRFCPAILPTARMIFTTPGGLADDEPLRRKMAHTEHGLGARLMKLTSHPGGNHPPQSLPVHLFHRLLRRSGLARATRNLSNRRHWGGDRAPDPDIDAHGPKI